MFLCKRPIETDDEFVCRVRKRIKTGRKLTILSLTFALLLLAGSLWFLFSVFRLIKSSSPEESVMWAGFFVGIMCGIFFSMLAIKAGHYIAEAMTDSKGRREDRLLIKYYDALTNPSEEKTGNTA